MKPTATSTNKTAGHPLNNTIYPIIAFDCAMRKLSMEFARSLLSSAISCDPVYDALRLQECDGTSHLAHVLGIRNSQEKGPPKTTSTSYFYVSTDGNDNNDGSFSSPFATLQRARDAARKLPMGTNSIDPRAVIMIRTGYYYLANTLVLSSLDSSVSFQAYQDEHVIISGGLRLHMTLVHNKDNIWVADLPSSIRTDQLDFSTLFLTAEDVRKEQRLPWAREPNGDPERNLQPDGYALVDGVGTATRWPSTQHPVPIEISKPKRNSSVYPIYGRDFDPRTPFDPVTGLFRGWQWLHDGGSASRFADNRSFWNGTISTGLRYNATGGESKGYNVSGFSTNGWTPEGYEHAIAHVFHDAYWGNWFFSLAKNGVNPKKRQIDFSMLPPGPGGWQEGHGGWMGKQPFFVEGVREALDSPGEWWIDRNSKPPRLYIYPNHTWLTPGQVQLELDVVAPQLKTLIMVKGSNKEHTRNVQIQGLTFTHTKPTFMEPYEVPSPGDWSIHRGGAIFIEGAEDLQIHRCSFLRVGGNALFLSGHVWRTIIRDNEFILVGDSAIATVGRINLDDGSVVDTYPADTTISSNHFRDIGVYGKQTSALFSALTCRTTFVGNVAYNGPRAGINLNDEFCHGHNISHNLLFNWVRETQDHGPINTWNRAMYLQRDPQTGQSTITPQWCHINHNLIMNGPSGNRDLGNMFPAVDNDDGSAFYHISQNVMVYGGAKNYLGYDKIWVENFIVFPDRWGGDPCAQIWGGQHHVFENNTCIIGFNRTRVKSPHEPIGLDGTMKGFDCVVDLHNKTMLPYIGMTAQNRYFTLDGDWFFYCGNATAKNHRFTLPEMQRGGWALGTSVELQEKFTLDNIELLARRLIHLPK